MSELNEAVKVTVQDAGVITAPIDATLTHSGEAADAKAVGDALSKKADKSELQNAVTVNGQAADAQGQIIVTGEDVKVSDRDTRTVKAAIDAAEGRTAEDIRMAADPTAQTIAQAMASSVTRTADQIAMSATDKTTVKGRMDSQQGAIESLQTTAEELSQQTGANIPYQTGSQESIKMHVDALEAGRVKTVNGIGPDADGNVAIERVSYADNLYTEDAEQVDDSFIIRTSGGSGSLTDGHAWAQLIRGNRVREGYVQERIQMTITPVPRTAPAAITATLDEATFEAFVGIAGTYTLTYYYAGGWDANPTDFGLAISNEPVDGDAIRIVWDGTNDAVMTIIAVPREVPAEITATIDRVTFVAYVADSGTITMVYGSGGWSEDPAPYGIDIQNIPVVGDQISIAYTKEVRGTITVAEPTRLVGTGWNLFRRDLGRARVVRYSDIYGYRIGGPYSAVTFAPTLGGTQVAVSVDADGLFQVPSDGYVFVTGGGTDTYILTTWSDWESGYVGEFEEYTEHAVDLTAIMATAFVYGLCRVGDVYDEIDIRHKQAISRIQRVVYTEEDRASAEASGRAFEFDQDYIYIERENPIVSDISLDEEYTVSEHGLEYFDGTDVPVYCEILYGTNLKDKLKRDVVTISEQTLTTAQQAQVQANLGVPSAASVNNNIAKLQQDIAIIVDGDSAALAVPVGGYAYIKNNTHGLAEGIYKNTSASAFPVSGGTADSTVFSAVPTGTVNDAVSALNEIITTLSNRTYNPVKYVYSDSATDIDSLIRQLDLQNRQSCGFVIYWAGHAIYIGYAIRFDQGISGFYQPQYSDVATHFYVAI